jgi:transposase
MTYSNDYKKNAIRLYNNRQTHNFIIDKILTIVNISRSTLYTWVSNQNEIFTNPKNKIKKRKKYSQITDECSQYIINYVDEYKQFKIKKLIKKINKQFNISISKHTIYNVLKKNKITNKKIKENHCPYNDTLLKEKKHILNKQLNEIEYNPISIDESGFYLYTNNNYGWSKIGTKCIIPGKNKMYMKKYSIAFAISRKKVIGYTLKSGAFNAKSFNKFMMSKVLNNNPHNQKCILDNAKIHHAILLNKKIKDKAIYNIPYCSQYNPIEMFFNTMKQYLNSVYIKSESSLRYHINLFIKKVNSIELNNYFNKAFSFLNN